MSLVLSLVQADLKNVVRDPILVIFTVLPVFVAVLFRFLFPFIARYVTAYVDLSAHYGFVLSMLLLMAPMMFGWVVGFLLLDERDEDILTAIAVTPVGKTGFLSYRLVFPVTTSFLLCFAAAFTFGLAEIPFLRLVPIALMTALEAPTFALFLAAFAANKIEGMAVGKLASAVMLAPFVMLIVPSGWQYLAGVVPAFWVSKACALSPGPWTAFGAATGVGLTVHSAVLILLWRKFCARAG